MPDVAPAFVAGATGYVERAVVAALGRRAAEGRVFEADALRGA